MNLSNSFDMHRATYSSVFIFFLLSFNLNAQVLIGTVTDLEYNPLIQSKVQDTTSKNSAICNVSGGFSLKITSNSILKVSHPEYSSQYFDVRTEQNSDTIYLNFTLTKKVQLVPEVIVTSERLKRVVDQSNVNIVDYLPFNDFILILKTSESTRFLSIEGVDTTFFEFNLGRIKAKSLFEDCYGNIHLLTKDSAYQIWIDSNLQIVSTSSIEIFNKLLKPCIANFSGNNVFYNFTNRNRKYTLTSINKKSIEKNFFFHIHDEIGEKVATSHYWSIISYYYQHIPEHENMIALKVWDGNLLTLNLYDPEFERMIIWYLKIRAVELNIQTCQGKDNLIVFDQFNDSIHVFNDQNALFTSKLHPFEKGSTVFDVIQDKGNNTFYERTIQNGVYTLTSLNHLFDGDYSIKKITISEVPFATNIKIFNDWVYFTIKENYFYGLYRLKMPITQPK